MEGICSSCGYDKNPVTPYVVYPMGPLGRPTSVTRMLCDLCSQTMTGVAAEYPQYFRDPDALKTVCYVGNAILFEIRKLTGGN